jgi:hypothetical protein
VLVLPKKCCDQEFALCFFLSTSFHRLILEHGYLLCHIKNSGTLIMLQFITIHNVYVAVFLDMYSV